MSRAPQPASSLVVAELGPTNTGKTHRAIERMLEHESGMMGLPLRLLAREVYDRVTARVGEGRVALVTGEEKRVPAHPSYWICTVEAMPTDQPVDFLAVDEIQLSAHRERGHVFTDRLLHARGRRETWFLGSDTMRPVMQTLIPAASFRRSMRLSQLRCFGRKSLKSLPPRSAVTAFSIDRVYEIAEALRRLRGGVAVVLGALSPRTRNAQVAMYQSGEVQYLVATDAIGMGLNLDLDRVAFAALSKYDGFEQRDLAVDELAQIAGRAGRHLNDGAFGTLGTAPELHPRTIAAIEAHRFPPVQRLTWRNSTLDFSSPEALLDALSRAPDRSLFTRVERADDFDALRELASAPEIREIANDRAGVELLWEVCQVPDFRKRLFGQHVALLRETFLQLATGGGELQPDWLAKQISPLEDASGDIYTLMDRLSAVRIWTYITQRSSWLRDAEAWQEKTRRIEDALGDALHQRLVERFVERAARRTPRRFLRSQSASAATRSDSPFAKLRELTAELQPQSGAALSEEQFVQQIVDATHEAFEVDSVGRIRFDGEPVARLLRGGSRRTPQVALIEADAWTGGARRRLQARLSALTRDLVNDAMGGFPGETLSAATHSAPLRGLAYQLAEGLGIVRRSEALPQWELLDVASRERLRALGVQEGRRFFFVKGALSTRALELRTMLTAVYADVTPPTGLPRQPVLTEPALDRRIAEEYGYERLGQVTMRVDVVERLASTMRDPRARTEVQTIWRELELDGAARTQVMQELGGGSGPHPRKRRGRRRRRKASAGAGSGQNPS
ncbi:MAG: helicase-related protein [Myxococcaceae bacterium]